MNLGTERAVAFHTLVQFPLFVGFPEGFDNVPEFHYFNVRRAVRPVVTPAYYEITTINRMIIVSAFEFKLDTYSLPSPSFDLAFCLAVRKPCLNRLYHVTQFFGNHSE